MSLLERTEDIYFFLNSLRRALRAAPAPTPPERPAPPVPLAVGQVWVAEPRGHQGVPCPVLLTRIGAPCLDAVVLSEQLWMATADDVVIPAEQGTVGLPLVACLWRNPSLAPSSLVSLLGTLDAEPFAVVARLLRRTADGSFPRTPLGPAPRQELPGASLPGPTLLRWSVGAPDGTSLPYLSGTRVLDDEDPRPLVRDLFEQATRYLEQEALALRQAPASAPEPALRLRWLRAVRRALEEAGARLFQPTLTGAATRTAGTTESLSIQGSLPLGELQIELDIRSEDGHGLLQILALRGEEPVPGVRLSILSRDEGREPLSLERETGPDGVIFALAMPWSESCVLELRYRQEQLSLRW